MVRARRATLVHALRAGRHEGAQAVSVIQGAAVLTLWRSGKFDTMQIAELLRLVEADVASVLAAALDAERAA
jgi:hypothetical protein